MLVYFVVHERHRTHHHRRLLYYNVIIIIQLLLKFFDFHSTHTFFPQDKYLVHTLHTTQINYGWQIAHGIALIGLVDLTVTEHKKMEGFCCIQINSGRHRT